MGSFICAISERDWEISRTKGIYGNKAGRLNQDGEYILFGPSTKYSIIRDLVGMKVGDRVFFHVITATGPSRVHGVYTVREAPYFDTTKVWQDPSEIFPFRFLFEPHHEYGYLCELDANIQVVDFYELIEQRKIWSLATLENEMNIEARSVRKIDDENEAMEIIRLLHRDLKQYGRKKKTTFSLIGKPARKTPLKDCIADVGQYENSVKALLMLKLSQNDATITDILGPISDFMNEVFIAQTTRKSIDILCIRRQPSGAKDYIVAEVKRSKCDSNSLKQVLYYMDLFKRKELVDITHDRVIGCLVGQRFESEVVEFSQRRNAQAVNGSIILMKYVPKDNGKDADFQKIA